MNRLYRLLLAAALLGAPTALRAGLLVNLDVASMSLLTGDTVTFSGSLVNEDATLLYLNSCAINLTGVSVAGDCTLFLLNAPLTIDPLATVTSFQMFTVTANFPYLDALGVQSGSLDVLGGSDSPADLNVLGTATFDVDVQAPEPATFWLFAMAALVAAPILRSRKGRPADSR